MDEAEVMLNSANKISKDKSGQSNDLSMYREALGLIDDGRDELSGCSRVCTNLGRITQAMEVTGRFLSQLRNKNRIDSEIFPDLVCVISRTVIDVGNTDNAMAFFEDNLEFV